MLLRPPCCAIVLLLLLPVIGICRAQSVDFRQPNQMSKSQIGGIGGAGAGPTGGVHPAQQQKSNLNLYDPMLTLYGHQQQHYGRSSANNGTWSAVGNFGTAPMPPLLTDAANGTTMALMQQQQQRNAAEGGRTANAGHGAVQVQVQLRSYANQGFRLPDGRLCTCPAGNERCLHASPQRNGYNCLTSLAVFVLSADDTIHFEETPYFPLNAAGQLGQQQEFGAPLRFNLNSEPSAIAVVVHNLGPQINMDGTLYETNTVTVVDTFVQPLVPSAMPMPSFASASRATATGTSMLNPFAAAAGGGIGQQLQQQQNVQLQGRLVGTQLSLAFSVACRGALVGPGCDLACNSSAANPSSAICQSRRSGFFSLCRWVNGGGGVSAQQVTDCKNCPWGIKENAYCADGQGGVLEPNHAGVVSSSYYTAFVVLCCVCALLLLCMLVACLLACKKVVRARRDAPSSFRRHQQLAAASRAGGNGIATSAPLITRGDPERVLLTAGNARPTESDDGGFNAAFRLGTGVEKGGAKPPPPPYSVRSNGNAAFGTDQRRVAEAALLPDAPSRTSPFALPRSNVASSASGRETPCVVAAGAGGTKNGGAAERHRFPPPLAISNAKIAANSNKTLSPPRFQPLPHLGPQQNQQTRVAAVVGGGGADSLNSSFAGGMAPPSVSADV